MALTKNEKNMATDVTASGTEDPGDPKAPERASRVEQGGMFTIFKKGQGYWTRMGTAGAAALLIVLISYNLYQILKDQFQVRANVSAGIGAGVAIALALWAWRMMNKPSNVDFLIATDSEMKKVNWTSKKDLFGATRVVIIFMFLIAAILLIIDVVFGYFFQLITVLKTGPFG